MTCGSTLSWRATFYIDDDIGKGRCLCQIDRQYLDDEGSCVCEICDVELTSRTEFSLEGGLAVSKLLLDSYLIKGFLCIGINPYLAIESHKKVSSCSSYNLHHNVFPSR